MKYTLFPKIHFVTTFKDYKTPQTILLDNNGIVEKILAWTISKCSGSGDNFIFQ